MLGEASASSEPCKSSFNDPSLRQDDKTLGCIRALDDFQFPASDQGDGSRGRLALVAAVGEDLLDECEKSAGFGKNRQRPIPVLDAGGLDLTDQDHAQSIDDDMPLDAFDFLAGVIADGIDFSPAAFRALDALAVDDRGGGACLLSRQFPHLDEQREVNVVQRAIPFPQLEVVMDRAARRQILRQEAPLASRGKNIKDGVHNLAYNHLAAAAVTLFRRDERRDQRPFGIRHITRIAKSLSLVMLAI